MGFASGFQAGSSAVERGLKMRDEEKLKEELAKINADPESFNDYTPAQQQQIQGLQASGAYDVEAIPGAQGQPPTLNYAPRQGLDLQGDMPGGSIQISPQPVQRYAGQTTAGQFSPDQREGLRARAIARAVMSSGDYRGGAALMADATRAEREAKEAPLRLRGLENQIALSGQQIESGNYDIATKKRTQEANVRTDAFSTWQSQNPNATSADMFREARRLGMPPEEQFKIASNVTGLKEQSLKNNELVIKEMVQNKSLDQLSALHKDNDLIDPGSHFEVLRSKSGQVTLQRVDSKTGKALGGPTFTGSEAEATRYLYQAATAPESIVDFTTTLEKTKAAIAASKATLTNALAQAGVANARVNLTKSQQTQLDDLNTNRKKALGYAEQFEELDEKEKSGEKGRNLIKQFNLFNAKAGGQTGLERMQPPEKPEKRISDASVATYAKELIGKLTGRMVNGKPERYTATTAPAAARKLLAGQEADETEAPDWKQ